MSRRENRGDAVAAADGSRGSSATRSPSRRARLSGLMRQRHVLAVAMTAVVLLPLQGVSPLSTSSFASEYDVYSCRVPYGSELGTPAPVEVAPGDGEEAGMWSRAVSGSAAVASATNTCDSSGAFTAALVAANQLSNLDDAAWIFTAPKNEYIVNGTRFWRAGDADGGPGYGFWFTTFDDAYGSTSMFGRSCIYSQGCKSGVGASAEPLSSENEVLVPSKDLPSEHLYINASCSEPSCPGGAGDADGYATVVYVYATDIVLDEQASPTVTNVEGALASDSPLSGTEGLTFDAKDEGSGVYESIVSIDGNVQERRAIDTDGGRCEQVGTAPDQMPAFLYAIPCPQSVNATVSLDTTKLADGPHTLLVAVTNAAGNETRVLERTVEVQNGSPQQGKEGTDKETQGGEGGGGEGSEGGGGEGSKDGEGGSGKVTGEGGQSTVGAGAGAGGASSAAGSASLQVGGLPGAVLTAAPVAGSTTSVSNGRGASNRARLQAAWVIPTGAASRTAAQRPRGAQRTKTTTARTIILPFGDAQAQIEGRLTAIDGAPIVGAKVGVSSTERYGGAKPVALRAVRTSKHGYFELALRRRLSSRTIKFSYASAVGGAQVAHTTLTLDVKAGVRLRVRPRTVTAGKTIVLSGRVLGGPIPASGKQVVLEAKAKGTHWLQFLALHTNRAGAFTGKHRFRLHGPMRYSFRAWCPAEADFPFLAGHSKAVTVSER